VNAARCACKEASESLNRSTDEAKEERRQSNWVGVFEKFE
jgi:hypothetical protein